MFHARNHTVRIPTYATLDDQLTNVFVTDALVEKLNTDGSKITLNVNTIVGMNSIRTCKELGQYIQDVEGLHSPINVNYANLREDIPADKYDIATPEIARQ